MILEQGKGEKVPCDNCGDTRSIPIAITLSASGKQINCCRRCLMNLRQRLKGVLK